MGRYEEEMMPKEINDDPKLNFSKTAQTRFDKFAENTNWSWLGLAMALVKKFSIRDVELFHFILGEVIKQITKERK
jgi:hypothetical protein